MDTAFPPFCLHSTSTPPLIECQPRFGLATVHPIGFLPPVLQPLFSPPPDSLIRASIYHVRWGFASFHRCPLPFIARLS